MTGKKVLGYRARSGDLRISMHVPLQSFALPTELNRDDIAEFLIVYIIERPSIFFIAAASPTSPFHAAIHHTGLL